MLSAWEFTVGAVGDAEPVSLVLPRTRYEETFLIGRTDRSITAVALSGQHAFQCFECAGNQVWRGLIVPNVRIEVDESSIFDPGFEGYGLGSIVRQDSHLCLPAKPAQSFRSVLVILEDNLMPTHDAGAAFSKWSIILGENENKRVLVTIDVSKPVSS